MQARVRRLERSSATGSPILASFGTFAAFEAHCEAEMAAGRLDARDFPVIVLCLRGWEEQSVWRQWQRDAIWQRGV